MENPAMFRIEEVIRRMPDLAPPVVLLQSVMGAVRARRLSPWVRVLRWFRDAPLDHVHPAATSPAGRRLDRAVPRLRVLRFRG